jgi:hypothetical protein
VCRGERRQSPFGSAAGRGYDVFRYAFLTLRKPISVFFHRGDSPGESGSNFYWLGRKRLRDVIACLEPGGLVVSDGSLTVRQFRSFHGKEANGSEAMQSAESFELAFRSWQCVGHLENRYGPTLVWKAIALDGETWRT